MHTVSVVNRPITFTPLDDVLIGQFVILHGQMSSSFNHYEGDILLRIQAGFVNLTKPQSNLKAYNYSEYNAEVLPAGSTMSLTTGSETFTPLMSLSSIERDRLRDIHITKGKIHAIKELRNMTGAGLRDAKDFVDEQLFT